MATKTQGEETITIIIMQIISIFQKSLVTFFSFLNVIPLTYEQILTDLVSLKRSPTLYRFLFSFFEEK